MTARTRVAGTPRIFLAVTLGLAGLLGSSIAGVLVPPKAAAAESALPAWTGGVELYRTGSFTTQRSWLWCTAADVQIARNIVDHQRDHSTASQARYFDWMRRHNRYDLPLSAGVDAQGWAAGMRHFVDDRYRLVSSGSFDAALRSAVERMRRTSLPVAITVSHGNHGWLLVGFRATADPARTDRFTVTSVRVVGPLYGLQSRNGYDMPPNTRLTPTQLRRFFTPWHYDPKPMIWDGRFISIQPIPRTVAAKTGPTATSKATPVAKPAAEAPTVVPAAVAAGVLAEGLAETTGDRSGAGAGGAVMNAGVVAIPTGPPPDPPDEGGAGQPADGSDAGAPAADHTALVAFFLVALPIAAAAALMLGPLGRRRSGSSG